MVDDRHFQLLNTSSEEKQKKRDTGKSARHSLVTFSTATSAPKNNAAWWKFIYSWSKSVCSP